MANVLDRLIALHESDAVSDGTGTYIIRRGNYLSGFPYLWSQFGERAFVFPSALIAEEVIRDCPEELAGAEVHQRYPEKQPC
jgi:hypothetical protein